VSTSTPSFDLQQKLTFTDVQDCLPSALRALADKGETILGLPPETVAAAGMAHLAAAIGRRDLIDDGISVTAPGFNFVACSDHVSSADWLTCLGRGWTEPAGRFKAPNAPAILELLKAATGSAMPGPSPQNAKTMPMSASCFGAVRIAEQASYNPEPANVARLLQLAPDACLTLINGSADPMGEWNRLTPGQKRKLGTLLWHSWQGRPMELSTRDVAIPGTLCCLWSTTTRAAGQAFYRSIHFSQSQPPPLLFFQFKGASLRYPDTEAPELKEWHTLLKVRHQDRANTSPEAYPLTVRPAAEEFARSVANEVSQQPAHLRPWLEWTSDLMPRIFMVLLRDMKASWEKRKKEKMAELNYKYSPIDRSRYDQIKFETEKATFEATIPKNMVGLVLPKALRLTAWLLQQHFRAVERLADEPGERPSFDSTDSTDKSSLPESILSRLRDKGPLLPRQLQRSFHRMTVKELDEATETLKSGGLVTQLEDGKLSMPS